MSLAQSETVDRFRALYDGPDVAKRRVCAMGYCRIGWIGRWPLNTAVMIV